MTRSGLGVVGIRANRIGAMWMIAAMAAFAVEDALIKQASAAMPVGQVLILFGAGGATIFALLARLTAQRLRDRAVLSAGMILRMGFEVTGRLFYVLALAMLPLSTVTVILQATPIVVVAAAALFLKERIGWRRGGAIALGLAGVMVILRPGGEAFSVLSILAVIGMLGFAGRDLASRAAPVGIGTFVLGFYGFLAVVVAGLIFALWSGEGTVRPGALPLAALAGAVLCGVAAYSCLMKAMRTGDVSAVTPFRYVRLIFGILLGVIFFGEAVGPAMIAGSGMILAAGLVILVRDRTRVDEAAQP